MTNEQAIKHLEERKRAAEEHVFAYSNMVKAEMENIEQIIIAYDMAIVALQKQQEIIYCDKCLHRFGDEDNYPCNNCKAIARNHFKEG